MELFRWGFGKSNSTSPPGPRQTKRRLPVGMVEGKALASASWKLLAVESTKMTLHGHPDAGTFGEEDCHKGVTAVGFVPVRAEWPSANVYKELNLLQERDPLPGIDRAEANLTHVSWMFRLKPLKLEPLLQTKK